MTTLQSTSGRRNWEEHGSSIRIQVSGVMWIPTFIRFRSIRTRIGRSDLRSRRRFCNISTIRSINLMSGHIVRLGVEVIEAEWVEDKWRVHLHDLETGHKFYREAEMVVSCVGTISIPKDCTIPNYENFQGTIFHSARWNHDYDTRGKSVAVIGNGCSGAQLMPYVVKTAGKVYQFQRSAQWINERPNREFTAFQKWCFRYIPLWNRIYRFYLWKKTDALHNLYLSGNAKAEREREIATQKAVEYMKANTPEKFQETLIPKFPLGCKRRIFDPGYLECLHSDNVEPIVEFMSVRNYS
ncbi:hypothetical protein V1515DRAFT_612394 [Lipomyces mesembrius]